MAGQRISRTQDHAAAWPRQTFQIYYVLISDIGSKLPKVDTLGLCAIT
jgi:hypothetical protein